MKVVGKNIAKGVAYSKIMRTFVVHSITRSGETASNKRADFLYPFVNIGYNTPSWIVNATTAPCEWNAEGKVVPFFCLQPCNNVK